MIITQAILDDLTAKAKESPACILAMKTLNR